MNPNDIPFVFTYPPAPRQIYGYFPKRILELEEPEETIDIGSLMQFTGGDSMFARDLENPPS